MTPATIVVEVKEGVKEEEEEEEGGEEEEEGGRGGEEEEEEEEAEGEHRRQWRARAVGAPAEKPRME